MNVLEYLQKKYEVEKPTTLLKEEARIFGIKLPLSYGWLSRHGGTEITPPMVFRLRQSLDLRAKNGNQFTKYAIEVISGITAEKPDFTHRRTKNKKKSRATKKPEFKPEVMSDAFLMSYEWRRVRMVALKKYGPKCQCCGATPDTGAVMNVDHIKPRRIFPDLALDVNNLQILCGDCNHGKGNWDMTDWRPAIVGKGMENAL